MKKEKPVEEVVGLFPMVADLLHPGHLAALRNAKQCCGKLIVALNTDPTDNPGKSKPIQTVFERWLQLTSCRYVDEVIPYCGEEDLMSLLRMTDYDVRFIGIDHAESWTGEAYEKDKGIPYVVVTADRSQSSTALKQRILESK